MNGLLRVAALTRAEFTNRSFDHGQESEEESQEESRQEDREEEGLIKPRRLSPLRVDSRPGRSKGLSRRPTRIERSFGPHDPPRSPARHFRIVADPALVPSVSPRCDETRRVGPGSGSSPPSTSLPRHADEPPRPGTTRTRRTPRPRAPGSASTRASATDVAGPVHPAPPSFSDRRRAANRCVACLQRFAVDIAYLTALLKSDLGWKDRPIQRTHGTNPHRSVPTPRIKIISVPRIMKPARHARTPTTIKNLILSDRDDTTDRDAIKQRPDPSGRRFIKIVQHPDNDLPRDDMLMHAPRSPCADAASPEFVQRSGGPVRTAFVLPCGTTPAPAHGVQNEVLCLQ
jgi:hypothetical protein